MKHAATTFWCVLAFIASGCSQGGGSTPSANTGPAAGAVSGTASATSSSASMEKAMPETKTTGTTTTNSGGKLTLSDSEWKQKLSPEQYRVLREAGTERAFTGKYWDTKTPGVYKCAGCGEVLFTSDQKFDSGCGWPSFDAEVAGGKIIKIEDKSFGMVRTEIRCAKCGGHLGHLFDDGPTSTGLRYCVNSASIELDANAAKPNDADKPSDPSKK